MKVLAAVMVLTVLSSPALSQDQTNTPSPNVTLVITGTIKNFDALSAHVVAGTGLQLVPLPPDGAIQVGYSFAGGKRVATSFYSELPSVPMPKQAAFTLEVPNVPPGRYFLAAQETNISWSAPNEGPVFLTDDEAMYVIDVPADVTSPFHVKAGDLVVRIHE
jgi:hypothetical protein